MRKGLQTFEPIELEKVKKTFDKTREIYNDITKEIVEYMKNYYEKIPQYSLERISFSLNSNPPLMIRIKEKLDNKDVIVPSYYKIKKMMEKDNKIKEYYKIWIVLKNITHFKIYNSEMNNYSPILIEHKNKNELYSIENFYSYKCDMFDYSYPNYHFYINKYKNYQKLKDTIKEYELLKLKYSDAINKELKLNIHSNQISKNFTLSPKHAKEIFQKATIITNKLLENLINDFLLPFTDDTHYINGILATGFNPTFGMYVNGRLKEDKTEIIRYWEYATEYDFVSSNKKHKTDLSKEFENFITKNNISTINMELFSEFYKTLETFSEIIFENQKSSIVLSEIFQNIAEINYDEKKQKYILDNDPVKFKDEKQVLDLLNEDVNISLNLKGNNSLLYNNWQKEFIYLSNLVDKYSYLIEEDIILENKSGKIPLHTQELFTNRGKVKKKFQNSSLLSLYDLSKINFDHKNISGLDISKNKEVKINFDKIIKDISDCNFNGYNLKKEVLRDFNIKDADLRNTGATIDLATCSISTEGKMNRGTLFDEDNTFLFFNEKLTAKQVKELNIKVYKKEK